MKPFNFSHQTCQGIFAVVAFTATMFFLDQPLYNLLTHTPVNAVALRVFTELGNGGVDLLLCLLLLILHRKGGKAAIGAFITGGLAVNLVKYSFGRARPYADASSWLFIGPTTNGGFGSFPSGHTTTVFALAVVAARVYPRYATLFYSLASLVGLSRIAIGMHWPSDVLGGALLGTAIAFCWIHKLQIQPQKKLPNSGTLE